jgi:putative peptidoglycan lipid II flippase
LALVYQAVQIIPYFARDSITRVFYAFQDSKTPLMVGLLAIFIKALLNWVLVIQLNLGVGGITFAITLVTFINMTLLGLLSKKHIQDLGFKEMVIPFIKLAVAGGLMAGAIYGVQWGLRFTPWQLWMSLRPEVIEYAGIVMASFTGCAVYLSVVLGLKVSEAQYLQERIGGRFLKRFSR